MTIGLSGHMSPALLKELAEEEVAYYLQRADGVAAVDIRGGQSREVLVALHRDRLAALGVTINQVASAIGSENTLQPAGVLETGTAELTLRTHGQIAEIEEIRNIIVATRNGIPVYLRDLGTVEERARGYESIVRIDGIPGIVLSVQKQSGSNMVLPTASESSRTAPALSGSQPGVERYFHLYRFGGQCVGWRFLAPASLLFFLYNFRPR